MIKESSVPSINIDFSNLRTHINSNFYELLKNKSRYLIIYGGSGSGKSVFAIQKMILRCLLNKEKFLFVRKFNVDCRKTVFSLTKYLIHKYNLDKICSIKESSMIIDFINGSQIIHLGCDNSEKIKSIPNVSSVFLEESTDFYEEDINQINLRLRGKTISYKQLILAFNPISSNHWLKKKFFDEEINNCIIHHSTYRDNKFIDKDYINVLNSLRDRNTIDVYKYGIWSRLEHSIFKNYEIIDNIDIKFNVKSARYGIDFGYHNAILLLVCYHNENIYVLDELHKQDINSNKFLEECKKRITESHLNEKTNNKIFPIIADCEDPSNIELFRNDGLLIKGCKKNKNSISDSINWLKNRTIFIDKKCKNIIEEISSYNYKKDKKTNIIYDEPDPKCLDHSLDSLRYACEDFIKPFKFNFSLGKSRTFNNNINF